MRSHPWCVLVVIVACEPKHDSESGADGSTAANTDESDSSGATEDGAEGVKSDVSSPVPVECAHRELMKVTVQGTTPTGEFPATWAWFAWNHCCAVQPYVALFEEEPVLEASPGGSPHLPEPHIELLIRKPLDVPDVQTWYGTYEATAWSVEGGMKRPVEGKVTISEPLERDEPHDANLPPVLHAHFEFDGPAASFTVTVEAPYCEWLDSPPCPCE